MYLYGCEKPENNSILCPSPCYLSFTPLLKRLTSFSINYTKTMILAKDGLPPAILEPLKPVFNLGYEQGTRKLLCAVKKNPAFKWHWDNMRAVLHWLVQISKVLNKRTMSLCYGKSNNTLCEWFKGSCVCVSAWVCVHDLSVPLHWNYLIILNRVLSIVLNPCNRNFAFQWFCPNPQSSLHPRSKLGSRPPSAGCKVQNSHFWRFHLK